MSDLRSSVNVPAAAACRDADAGPADADELGRELMSGFAHRFIRHKSRQVVRKLSGTSRDDLEQELRLLLCERFPQFDPALSDWPAFVTTVIERRIATLLEGASRKKRLRASVEVSLSSLSRDPVDGDAELQNRVMQEDLDRLRGTETLSDLEELEQKLDWEAALSSLRPQLRQVIEALRREQAAAAARSLGLTRRQIQYLLDEVRQQPEFLRKCRDATEFGDISDQNAVAP